MSRLTDVAADAFSLAHCHTPEKTFVHVQARLQVQMRYSVTTTLGAGEACDLLQSAGRSTDIVRRHQEARDAIDDPLLKPAPPVGHDRRSTRLGLCCDHTERLLPARRTQDCQGATHELPEA